MNSTVAEITDGPFGLTITGVGSTRTITTTGELDLATAKTLGEALDDFDREGAETIVLDLGQLEFIDSSGLALLVINHKRFNLAGDGRSLWLLPARANGVRRAFEITGLDKTLPFSEAAHEDPEPLKLAAA